MTNLKSDLIDLFTKVASAHQLAFGQDGNQDEDWAYRYADMLQRPLSDLLGHKFSRAQIVTCLMAAEDERQVMAEVGQTWQEVYADHFLNRFAPVLTDQAPKLSLYYYPECPFCQRVLHAIRQTGADVELRHVWEQPEYRRELLEARGRGTVPVLRISVGDGTDRWVPESADIVRFLNEQAA